MWRGAHRLGSWRRISVWLQLPLALLFYGLLFPPPQPQRADALTVLTPGTSREQLRHLPTDQAAVSLPDATGGADRMPDLATALRRHPQIRELTVIGGGLPARDRPAAEGMVVHFDAAPAWGVVDLQAAPEALLGTQWFVSGRSAKPWAPVELHDPSGALVDSVKADAEGRFRVSATLRGTGALLFRLQVDGDAANGSGTAADTISVPVIVHGGHSLSLVARAGSPDPDFKYWRRWTADAGFDLAATAALSPGIALRDGDTQLAPAKLATTDVVIIDERAWPALSVTEKTALREAVENGMGLLLRVQGAPDPAVASDWAGYGYTVTKADTPSTVTLDHRTGLRERAPFTMAPVTADAPGAVPVLQSDDGITLASWRTLGRGRVGMWTLVDSYRLVLLGETARYGGLWADMLGALARPQARTVMPELPAEAWLDQRSVVCGLADAASIVGDDEKKSVARLLIDARGCAAWWPAKPGWHRLLTGGDSQAFYVRELDDGDSLRMARDRAATMRMVMPLAAGTSPALEAVPGRRWPWFLAWLLLAAALWWRERRLSSAVT